MISVILFVLQIAAGIGLLISIPFAANDPARQTAFLTGVKIYLCTIPVVGFVRTLLREKREVAMIISYLVFLVVIVTLTVKLS